MRASYTDIRNLREKGNDKGYGVLHKSPAIYINPAPTVISLFV